jgi:two-component system response regulator VanR
MEIKILVVEDDDSISDIVNKFLTKEGCMVDVCADGDSALEKLYDNKYHLIILDIMLPGMSGQELLKEYRKIGDSPVLMMTALDDDDNQIKAFTNEADDYVTKPFSMQVFIKRVEALLRRSGTLKKTITVGKLVVYTECHKAEYNGTVLQLPPKEYEILLLLAHYNDKVLTRETLLTRIWGFDFEGNEGIVHATINRLRDKLPVNIIKTIKGVGYCLEEETK